MQRSRGYQCEITIVCMLVHPKLVFQEFILGQTKNCFFTIKWSNSLWMRVAYHAEEVFRAARLLAHRVEHRSSDFHFFLCFVSIIELVSIRFHGILSLYSKSNPYREINLFIWRQEKVASQKLKGIELVRLLHIDFFFLQIHNMNEFVFVWACARASVQGICNIYIADIRIWINIGTVGNLKKRKKESAWVPFLWG